MVTKQPLILIIDDEPAITTMLRASLEDEGFVVHALADGSRVMDTIGALTPDMVLLDIFMPNFDGLAELRNIKRVYPHQNIIMLSGFGTIKLATSALHNGARDFIEKPYDLNELLAKLAFLKTPPTSTPSLLQATTELVGQSALFNELLAHARLIAPLTAPVIIYGPAGSGKTLLAQYLHAHSTHTQEKLLTTTPAQLNTQTQQKSLSTSSTTHTQEHLFGVGTVFIRHLDHATPPEQLAILAHVQAHPNIRYIASSSPNLFAKLAAGTFNRQLFCAFNATPIEIASINKRRYDIPLLVAHFAKTSKFTPGAIRLLRNYQWTGDVAQIKQVIATLITQASHAIIDERALQQFLPEQPQTFVAEQLYLRFNSLDDATKNFQQAYLQHLLKTYHYDTNQLAEFLNMPRSALQDTIVRLNLITHA